MKIYRFTKEDAIRALTSYPRHYTDPIDNYPESMGIKGLMPEDCSGTEKHEFDIWAWFSNDILTEFSITKLVEEYNKLGGSITVIKDKGYEAEVELTEKDALALIKGGLRPNHGNSHDYELRKLGANSTANGGWVWNTKVLDGTVPYDTPIDVGCKTILEDLLKVYSIRNGSSIIWD